MWNGDFVERRAVSSSTKRSSNDKSRAGFLEKTKLERERRAQERLKEKSAVQIQKHVRRFMTAITIKRQLDTELQLKLDRIRALKTAFIARGADFQVPQDFISECILNCICYQIFRPISYLNNSNNKINDVCMLLAESMSRPTTEYNCLIQIASHNTSWSNRLSTFIMKILDHLLYQLPTSSSLEKENHIKIFTVVCEALCASTEPDNTLHNIISFDQQAFFLKHIAFKGLQKLCKLIRIVHTTENRSNIHMTILTKQVIALLKRVIIPSSSSGRSSSVSSFYQYLASELLSIPDVMKIPEIYEMLQMIPIDSNDSNDSDGVEGWRLMLHSTCANPQADRLLRTNVLLNIASLHSSPLMTRLLAHPPTRSILVTSLYSKIHQNLQESLVPLASFFVARLEGCSIASLWNSYESSMVVDDDVDNNMFHNSSGSGNGGNGSSSRGELCAADSLQQVLRSAAHDEEVNWARFNMNSLVNYNDLLQCQLENLVLLMVRLREVLLEEIGTFSWSQGSGENEVVWQLLVVMSRLLVYDGAGGGTGGGGGNTHLEVIDDLLWKLAVDQRMVPQLWKLIKESGRLGELGSFSHSHDFRLRPSSSDSGSSSGSRSNSVDGMNIDSAWVNNGIDWDRGVLHALHLLCILVSRLLSTVDDDEFHTSDNPSSTSNIVSSSVSVDGEFTVTTKLPYMLSIEDFAELTTALNELLLHLYWLCPQGGVSSSLTTTPEAAADLALSVVATKTYRQLYARNSRRKFLSSEAQQALYWSQVTPTDLRTIGANSGQHSPDNSGEGYLRPINVSGMSFARPQVLHVLSELPHVIPFRQRVELFQHLRQQDKEEHSNPFHRGLGVQIRREHMFEDGFREMYHLSEQVLKGRLQISFVSAEGLAEPGIDGGGLFKEFVEQLVKTALDPNFGLFLATTNNLIVPNPASAYRWETVGPPDYNTDIIRNYEQEYEFLGMVLGKVVYEGMLVEPEFANYFLEYLQGKELHLSSFDDLYNLDPALYRQLVGLKRFADKGGDVSTLGLYFEVTVMINNRPRQIPLKPYDGSVAVTNKNYREYVRYLANYKLNLETRHQSVAFQRGFQKLIPPRWIKLFSAPELKLLLNGDRVAIDIDDMRRHISYQGGYHPSQPYVQDFWKVVESFETEDQASLLKFITSVSRQPLLGFKTFIPPIGIQQVPQHQPGDDPDGPPRLPSASTCFNLLKLPKYSSIEVLKDKLLYAVRSKSGFELS